MNGFEVAGRALEGDRMITVIMRALAPLHTRPTARHAAARSMPHRTWPVRTAVAEFPRRRSQRSTCACCIYRLLA